MGTLESSFFGHKPDDDKQPGVSAGGPSWMDKLSAWLPLTSGKRPFKPSEFLSSATAAYGSAPGFGTTRRPTIPESVSRWSSGFRSPWGSGPGGFLNREKWFILGVTLFILFWTVVYVNTAFVAKYDSKAMLIVKDSAITSSYVATSNPNGSGTTSSSASNPVLNMIGLINASSVRSALYDYFVQYQPKVLQKYKIKDAEDWEAFYGDGSSFVKAKNMPGTDLIQVNFTWDDPKTAREGLKKLLQAFQNESLNINQAEQRNRSLYLDSKVGELTQQLNDIRTKKSAYKTKMASINLLKESEELSKTRLELGTRLNSVLAAARGRATEAARYERMLGMTPDEAVEAASAGVNSSVSKLYDQLYSLKQNEANLLASLTDKNPRVIEVQETIKAVEKNIKAEESRLVGPNHTMKRAVSDTTRGELVKQMATAQAEANSLQQQALLMQKHLSEVEGTITRFPQVEEGLANLEQEERSLSASLDSLKQKALEAHIKEAETLSNIFIIDQPSLPDKEKFPGKNHLLLLGLISGFALGTGLAFLKHKLRNSNPNPIGSEDDTLFDVLHPGTGIQDNPTRKGGSIL